MLNRFSQKPETSEKLKAKQYGAAALLYFLVAAAMTVVRFVWGGVLLGSGGDKVPLGAVIFLVRNMVLLFGAIEFFSAVYHFYLWNRNGRKRLEDDDSSLLSDWKSGERSPVKVSLVLMAGILVLALVVVIQG